MKVALECLRRHAIAGRKIENVSKETMSPEIFLALAPVGVVASASALVQGNLSAA